MSKDWAETQQAGTIKNTTQDDVYISTYHEYRRTSLVK